MDKLKPNKLQQIALEYTLTMAAEQAYNKNAHTYLRLHRMFATLAEAVKQDNQAGIELFSAQTLEFVDILRASSKGEIIE